MLLLIFTVLSQVPVAVVLTSFLRALPAWAVLELTHLILFILYVGWIALPIVGYQLTEYLDVSQLLHYPVASWVIYLGAMLSNFLDVSSFLVYPYLVGIGLGLATNLWQGLAIGAILLLLTLQAFGLSQLACFVLLSLMNQRRFSDLVLIVIPLVGCLLLLIGGMNHFLSPGGANAFSGLPLSTYLAFLPSGVATSALVAVRSGDHATALYFTAILMAITGLTILVAARVTDRILCGSSRPHPLSRFLARALALPASKPGTRRASFGSRLVRWAHEWTGNGPVAAMALKEWKLLVREPEIRLALGIHVLVASGLLWRGLTGGVTDAGIVVMPTLAFSTVLTLARAMLNSVGLERDGLRFLAASPVHPLVFLVGNNLAQWFLSSLLSTTVLLLAAWALRASTGLLLVHIFLAQGMSLLLLGMGNVSSVLVPYRLPARGVMPRQSPSAGRSFLVIAMGSACSMASVGLALLSLVALFVPPLGFTLPLYAINFPLTLAGILALYCMFTAVAGWLLTLRHEALLQEMTD